MNKALLVLSLALVALAMIGGFYITGGPFQARMEGFDQKRWSDLNSIISRMTCKDHEDSLPQTLSIEQIRNFCRTGVVLNESSLSDPETGDLYVYQVTSPTTFEVCARFYDFEVARQPYRRVSRSPRFGHVSKGDLICFKGRVNTSD